VAINTFTFVAAPVLRKAGSRSPMLVSALAAACLILSIGMTLASGKVPAGMSAQWLLLGALSLVGGLTGAFIYFANSVATMAFPLPCEPLAWTSLRPEAESAELPQF